MLRLPCPIRNVSPAKGQMSGIPRSVKELSIYGMMVLATVEKIAERLTSLRDEKSLPRNSLASGGTRKLLTGLAMHSSRSPESALTRHEIMQQAPWSRPRR